MCIKYIVIEFVDILIKNCLFVALKGLSHEIDFKTFDKKLQSLAQIKNAVQKNFSPRLTLLQFNCPHRPASWTGKRAGSPFS